jgi:hypothetical protein
MAKYINMNYIFIAMAHELLPQQVHTGRLFVGMRMWLLTLNGRIPRVGMLAA